MTRPPLTEALSRLHAGELPDDEARALRQRIDTEPDVAAAWAELLRLVTDLRDLVDEPPPAALDAAVLGRKPQRSVAPWIALAAAVLLAVAVAARWSGTTPAEVYLAYGAQEVVGAAVVVAGDVPVRVDGRATISVEPVGGVAREPSPSEVGVDVRTKMAGAAIGGGVVGAVLTVVVLEGTATVEAGGGPVVVEAGQTAQFPANAPKGGERPPLTGPLEQQVAQLVAENDALRTQLAEAQFSGAMARGQVAVTMGEPVPWTDDVPAAFRPEAFEALLGAELAKLPGLELQQLDCSEFPCIATITAPAGDDWQGSLKALAQGVSAGLGPEVGTWLGISMGETDQGVVGGAGLAFAPEGDMEDGPVRTRLDWRAKGALEELADTMEHEGGAGGAGEVNALDVLDQVTGALPGHR